MLLLLLLPDASQGWSVAGRWAVAGLGGVLAAACAVWLVVRQQSRAIRAVAALVKDFGEGDFGRRVWPAPGTGLETLAQAINAMAGGVESQIHTLAAQKQRMETILGGMREGLMVLDASGRVLTVNAALEDMFPQSGQSVGRLPIEAIASPELQSACETVLKSRDTDRTAAVSIQIETGQDRYFDVSLVRLSLGKAGLGAVLVFHDLSTFRRLDKVRRDFVANVSHELRTPLTSIKGYAETLLGEAEVGDGPSRRFLEIILKNANHMTKMVEELLGLARIENDKRPPAKAEVSAQEAFRAALRECAALAAERRVTVTSLLPAEGPLVHADFGQLTQVFRNLMENAIKYGPEDSTVTVSYRQTPDDVTFCVEDQGPGVPEAERQRVFERFYRVDRPRSKGEGGTGLGLAIAKHIVERHGGRIWAEQARLDATDTSGAAFCFSLPG